MKHINFSKGRWENDDFSCAYTMRWDRTPAFIQERDHVRNERFGEGVYDFDYISYVSKEKYCGDIKISAQCSFDNYGAPLIVIADNLTEDENGVLWYNEYYEVVLYEKGINVWHLYPEDSGKIVWDKLLGVEFPVSAGEKHTLSVRVIGKKLFIEADDKKMTLLVDKLYDSFHVGITACEEINRFYSMTVEENISE